MNKTKLKILESALFLFNEAGTIGVVLQKIADQAGVSIGNLNYHFKNKDEIIIELFKLIQSDVDNIFNNISIIPSEKEIIEIEYRLINLQNKYRFLYIDTVALLKRSEAVKVSFRKSIEHQVNLIYSLMQLGVLMNTYKAEEKEGEFLQLAKIIWNLYFNRISRAEIIGETYDLKELAEDIWLVIKAFLTDEGKVKYRKLLDELLKQGTKV